jgi:ribA/ribD-fused uncharacterized protein
MPDVIEFTGADGEFGCFSNHAPYPIQLKGKSWPTSEHYFQAQKFAGGPHEEAIRLEPSSARAAEMGRDRSQLMRNDWESVKETLMREAVLAKFRQHPSAQKILLGTGSSRIVEHSATDRYWGDGGDGSGKNMLGRILMEVREDLRKGAP